MLTKTAASLFTFCSIAGDNWLTFHYQRKTEIHKIVSEYINMLPENTFLSVVLVQQN